MEQSHRLSVNTSGERLDVFLASQPVLELSRAAAKRLITGGFVEVNGNPPKPSTILSPQDVVSIDIPEPVEADPAPQDIPLDIVYEDENILVVNKQEGLVVHPAPGNPDGTLVNALLAHCHELTGIGGVKRPGIVHRLDKDTSGLMVVAKNERAHASLVQQLKARSVKRRYLALVDGNIREETGTIDASIGRHPTHRKRMAVVAGGKEAVTHFRVLERFGHCTLVECRLETGRTHQIRVHMAYIGHPVLGDTTYGGGNSGLPLQTQALHAYRLAFRHPRTGALVEFEAPPPASMQAALHQLRGRIRA